MTDERLEKMLNTALTPDIDDKDVIVDLNRRKEPEIIMTNKVIKRVIIAAACMTLVIGTTAFAGSKIKYLESHSSSSSYNNEFSDYSSLVKAENKAGYNIDTVESFSNGYTFKDATISDTDAIDEDGNKVLSFKELTVIYNNLDDNIISLSTLNTADYNNPDDVEPEPDEVRNIDGIDVKYTLYSQLLNTPEDYELTDEEKTFDEARKLWISYDGGTEIDKFYIAVISWEKDGIGYSLFDHRAEESADSLFGMAEELIMQ